MKKISDILLIVMIIFGILYMILLDVLGPKVIVGVFGAAFILSALGQLIIEIIEKRKNKK